jgi:hypothetical protein
MNDYFCTLLLGSGRLLHKADMYIDTDFQLALIEKLSQSQDY